jgi:Protein of unknown function (DUF1697)
MPRYVALLRGVSPLSARTPELKACSESAGFSNVKTVLSSGTVVFDSEHAAQVAIETIDEHAISGTAVSLTDRCGADAATLPARLAEQANIKARVELIQSELVRRLPCAASASCQTATHALKLLVAGAGRCERLPSRSA